VSTAEPTPTPAPDVQTVVADAHAVLDTAQVVAQQAVTGIEHAGFGHLVGDAKQLVERAFETLKQDLHNLLHGAPPVVPAATTAPDSTPTA
jgi:hypothetical protein